MSVATADPQARQTALLPKLTPEEVIGQAVAENAPVASVALFSGGHDSTVLAHRCRDHYERLAFIDTGTAVPGVREFVESFAEWIGKPLEVLDSGDKFRRMVLGEGDQRKVCRHCEGTGRILGARCGDCEGTGVTRPLGFPGPAQHNRAYNQLKERQLRRLRAHLQEGYKRGARVLFLTGVRRAESERRKSRMPITFHGSIVFANPLIDWTADMMRAYRTEHRLPESDVSAILHRSGECNCGSFAAPGEREMLAALYPEWFEETIASLEREAAARGIPACIWGTRPPNENGAPSGAGPLCTDCQLNLSI